jgi:DNA-binding transcriptional MerR regulator
MTSAHNPDIDEDFMSPVEVQAALGVSRRTLWRYRQRGLLAPAHHTPTGHARFRKTDVEALRRGPVAEEASA